MKLKSSLVLIVGSLLALGCATVASNSTPLISDYQTMAEQTFISGIQYHLEDTYDYDVFFIIQRVIKQALLSGTQYYLKDIYDYDDAFLVSQQAIKQTDDSKNLLDYFAVFSIYDETLIPRH